MAYSKSLKDVDRAIDIGIITIVPTEIEALFAAFSITPDQYESAGSPLQYWRTSYQSQSSGRALSVVISILGGEAGNTEAAIATTQFLRDWYPRLMCLVGIAAGIEGKARIGDAVVPNKVHDRTIKVLEGGTFKTRGRTYSRNDILDRMLKVSPILPIEFISAMQATAGDDLVRTRAIAESKGLIPNGFSETPRVLDGSIISDNVLIRDPAYFSGILDIADEKCRGGEMEAAGFVLACQKEQVDYPWLVFRGISDFGDSRKDDSFQLLAAKSACAALRVFIEACLSIEMLPPNPRAVRASATLDASLVGELRNAYSLRRWKEVSRIGSAISRTLWLSGHVALRYEIGKMVEDAAAFSQDVALRARTLIDDLGWTAIQLRNMELGRKHICDGIRLGLEAQDSYVVAKGYRHLASLSRQDGDLGNAASFLAKAKKEAEAISDEDERAEMFASLQVSEAKLKVAHKDYKNAIPLLLFAQEAFVQLRDVEREVKIYGQLAQCQDKLGNSQEAENLYIKGRDVARVSGRFDEFVSTSRGLMEILARSKDARCASLAQEVYGFALSHGLWDEARAWQREFSHYFS